MGIALFKVRLASHVARHRDPKILGLHVPLRSVAGNKFLIILVSLQHNTRAVAPIFRIDISRQRIAGLRYSGDEIQAIAVAYCTHRIVSDFEVGVRGEPRFAFIRNNRQKEFRIGIAWFISSVPYYIFIISEFIPGNGVARAT